MTKFKVEKAIAMAETALMVFDPRGDTASCTQDEVHLAWVAATVAISTMAANLGLTDQELQELTNLWVKDVMAAKAFIVENYGEKVH